MIYRDQIEYPTDSGQEVIKIIFEAPDMKNNRQILQKLLGLFCEHPKRSIEIVCESNGIKVSIGFTQTFDQFEN